MLLGDLSTAFYTHARREIGKYNRAIDAIRNVRVTSIHHKLVARSLSSSEIIAISLDIHVVYRFA